MSDLLVKDVDGWLALREASEKLGVSPATLRAWADEGRVQSYRTPGGHRRFRVNEAGTPFQKEKRGGDARWRPLGHSVMGRLQLAHEESEGRRYAAEEHAQERELERTLIRSGTLALQSGDGDGAEQASRVGASFGKFNWRYDISQRDALATLGRLRRAFIEGIVEFSFGMGDPDIDELNVRLGRVNQVIDRVSVFMLEYRNEEPKPNVGK